MSGTSVMLEPGEVTGRGVTAIAVTPAFDRALRAAGGPKSSIRSADDAVPWNVPRRYVFAITGGVLGEFELANGGARVQHVGSRISLSYGRARFEFVDLEFLVGGRGGVVFGKASWSNGVVSSLSTMEMFTVDVENWTSAEPDEVGMMPAVHVDEEAGVVVLSNISLRLTELGAQDFNIALGNEIVSEGFKFADATIAVKLAT